MTESKPPVFQGDYYDGTFCLRLSLNDDSLITVQRVTPIWNQLNQKAELKAISELISSGRTVEQCRPPSSIFSNESSREKSASPRILIRYGEETIAAVLLPNKKESQASDEFTIRQQFIEKWAYGRNKIRLCLLYSEEDREELLKIPWEYLYLRRKGNTTNDLTCFLGQRSDISIVHSLYPNRYINPESGNHIFVEALPIRLKYLSWFGPDSASQKNEQDIYDSFVENLPSLEAIVESNNLKGSEPAIIEDHAEQTDFVIALRAQHFVHVSSHGDDKGIALKLNDKDDKVYPIEIENFSEEILKANQTKVVILLNCISSAGDSLARKLHQVGISIVIGITGSIAIDAASRFVDGLYSSLATWPGHGLERAVVEGRKNILRKIGGEWSTEFGYPRLFLNSPHSTLIPKHLLYESVTKMAKRFETSIQAVEEFDDEKTQEWQKEMKQWINQHPEAPQRQWLLVTGPAGEGKSTQIKVLLKTVEDARSSCSKAWNSKNGQESSEETNQASNAPPSSTNEEVTVSEPEIAPENVPNPDTKTCPQKILFHFCDDDYPETCRALDFVRDSLVPQLIKLYQDVYKETIPDGQFPLLVHNADQALWDFVIIPLSKLIEARKIKKPVIVIDNVDFVPEAQDPINSVLGLLFRHRNRLETVARFLVTADKVDASPLDLDGQQEERPNEISTNVYELTHYTPDDNDIIFINSSEEPSSYLFDKLVNGFKAKGFELSSIPHNKSWRDFDQLLDVALDNAIDIASKDKLLSEGCWRHYILRFLNIIAISVHPLSAPDIAAVVGLFPDGAEKKRIVSVLSPFLKEVKGDTTALNFYHKRLKTYILSKIRYVNNRENLADTHKLFVDAFLPVSGKWSDLNWKTLEGSKWPRQSEQQGEITARYIQHFLAYHAYHSCYYTSWRMLNIRRERAQAYLDLICDSGFRTARSDSVRRVAAWQDIWLGLRVIMAEYIHTEEKYHTRARVAFDRLLAAHQPNSYQRNALIELEEKLRTDPNAGWQDLFAFLGFDEAYELTWW